ncbi:hypothetical protein SAMN05421881_11033 [Nitrosomonas halophila]|uniref:Uncharacterized protein n=1 Tax=Nitrosomonas halophila TaxID=44576 RepID=A0A1H3PMJ0_9PROT|nr:hypothetical protein SAMN05421881_11033 [Nitrosomonas halophila]
MRSQRRFRWMNPPPTTRLGEAQRAVAIQHRRRLTISARPSNLRKPITEYSRLPVVDSNHECTRMDANNDSHFGWVTPVIGPVVTLSPCQHKRIFLYYQPVPGVRSIHLSLVVGDLTPSVHLFSTNSETPVDNLLPSSYSLFFLISKEYEQSQCKTSDHFTG